MATHAEATRTIQVGTRTINTEMPVTYKYMTYIVSLQAIITFLHVRFTAYSITI